MTDLDLPTKFQRVCQLCGALEPADAAELDYCTACIHKHGGRAKCPVRVLTLSGPVYLTRRQFRRQASKLVWNPNTGFQTIEPSMEEL